MNQINLAILSAMLEQKGIILWELQRVAQFKGGLIKRHRFVSLREFWVEALQSDPPVSSVHTSQVDVTRV